MTDSPDIRHRPSASAPRIPARGDYTEAARLERLAWLRRLAGVELEALTDTRLDAERLSGNVENMIGAVELPVGLAGPLLFRGGHAVGLVCAPIATTEGALVASVTRGARALTEAGGVETSALAQRMTRAPAFVARTPAAARRLAAWLHANEHRLRAEAESVSRNARLAGIETVVDDVVVHAIFAYETGEAAGQNMTTACTWRACQWALARLAADGIDVVAFYVEGNMSSDKKVSRRTLEHGRGVRAVATAEIPDEVLRRVLKIDAAGLLRGWHVLRDGGRRAGMAAVNVNVANVVAGLFAATGQDVACVHECSLARLEIEPTRGGVRARLELPSLIVATVGGGTGLPAQRALLDAMGCSGPGSARRLAEIIAGFALGLDLSTLAAIATGEFASAHERLGRNRPVRWLVDAEIGPAFVQPALRTALGDPTLVVAEVAPRAAALGSSIVTELTARRGGRLLGFRPLAVHHAGAAGERRLEALLKVKPLDDEVLLMFGAMAAGCGAATGALLAEHREALGFIGCHARELAVYEQVDPRFTRHAPRAYGTWSEPARELYAVLLEDVGSLALRDSTDDLRGWTTAHRAAAVRGIAEVHAIWLGREAELMAQPWIGVPPSAARVAAAAPLWEALVANAADEFPELVTPADRELLAALARTAGEWWPRLEAMPRTLVHGDFNPRNLCFRGRADAPELCAYDWELAALHVPQRDLAELLAFTLGDDADAEEVATLVELHRTTLERSAGVSLDAERWREGYALALCDFAVTRLTLYLMAQSYRQYPFLPRVVAATRRLLSLELGVPA